MFPPARFIVCALGLSMLSMLWGSVSLAQPPSTSPTYEYVIQPGDTCAGIAERLFGNKRRYDLIHQHNPGMGPTPHRLIAGQILILPKLDGAADAQLTEVRRTVRTRRPGTPDWARAEVGEDLFRGWRVNTLERASADVTFRDGPVVQMRENTLIIIYGVPGGVARRRTTEATLERGTLRSRLGELRLDVRTPSAAAELERGSSVVSVDPEGTSRLSNHEGGDARFAVTQGEAVTVKPGFGSKAKRGDPRPTEPAPLPPAPEWILGGPSTFIGARGTGATVRGAWSPVAAASSYHVELTRSGDDASAVFSANVPSTIRSFEAHGLESGEYSLQVSTIDEEGLESPLSSALAIRVRLVEIRTLDGSKLASAKSTVDESAEPPPPIRVFPGAKLVSPEGYRCGPAGSPHRTTVTLADSTRIVCTSNENEPSTELRVTVVAPSLDIVEPDPLVPLVRGAEPTLFVFSTKSALPLPPSTQLHIPNELIADEVSSSGETTRLRLGATRDSPDELRVALVTEADGETTVLASALVQTVPPDELDFAPNEALGLTLSPDLLGLTNDRREGTGPFLTVGYFGDLPSQNGYLRATVGVEVAPTRRSRIGLAVPADLAKRGLNRPLRGDQDMLLWGGYRILTRRDLSIDTELGLWIPLRDRPESIRRPRFAPAIQASYLVVERLLLRTRQGTILETSSDGPFLWASAYGFDIKLVRFFAISAELDVALGRALGSAITAVGGGPGLSVLAGPAAIYFAARFAATDDFEFLHGRYNLTGGLRLLF